MPKSPTTERWQTAITLIEPGRIAYRGVPIEEVIESWSFPATVWLLLQGEAPTPAQEDAIRRVLVAACDHGLAAPSIAAARTVASTRGAPGVAMAAGLIAFSGPSHGGAAGACAKLLREIAEAVDAGASPDDAAEAAVAERNARRERLPGFGHPYHPADPRVPGLLAASLPDHRHHDLVRALEAAIVRAKGAALHMNADAAVAAVLLDAGLSITAIDLVTSIGRCVGLAAHVREEIETEAPFRAPSLTSIEYVGPARKVAEQK